jgi:hypothetical protein
VIDGELFYFLKEVKPAQAGIRFFFKCPSQKLKLKLWRLPKIEDSMGRWSVSPFGPPI